MIDYLNIKHEYGNNDCLTLIKDIYKNELSIDLKLPKYTASKRWMFDRSEQEVRRLLLAQTKEITLTTAENFDLLVFIEKPGVITHFGLFLKPNRMLHLEENSVSCIETLSDYWVNSLYGVYRHKKLV